MAEMGRSRRYRYSWTRPYPQERSLVSPDDFQRRGSYSLLPHDARSCRRHLFRPDIPQVATSRKLSFEIVKAAVRQLRFDHPAIATQFAWRAQPPSTENAIFAYDVPSSETDVDEWLSKVVVYRDDVLSSTGRWKTKIRGWRCRMGIHLL